MRGINEQLLKTSGVDVLPSTKKLKKHQGGGGGGGLKLEDLDLRLFRLSF